jgi:ribulokinase
MSEDSLVLGIDCGTQSLRAGLFRLDGASIAAATEAYATDRPHTNWAEQNPDDWWQALCRAVRRCLKEAHVPPQAIGALACDGTSCTVVFCDAHGAVLRPAILWMDIRAADEARRVEQAQHPVLDHCGRRISAEWLVPKVLWVQRRQPEVYARAARIVEGVDWLVYRLCGRWVTSNSNAAGKRHWTPQDGWPAAFYGTIGLAELAAKSPEAVVYLGEPVGPLLPEAAEALGLSPRCIVAHAGMDGWTAPVGKNCTAPGCASLTLGTSTVVIVETDTPRVIDGVMGPFPDGIRRGRWVYEAGQTSGGSTIQWLLAIMGVEHDPAAHARLENAAERVPAGSDGLVVFDAWRGNRTPYFDPEARGTICGLTLEHGPAHLYRAVLEGCAYGIRNVIKTIEDGECPVHELRACGSGAGNRLWIRIIANVTGKPVLVSCEKHATCLGSAVCAAVACGAYGDLSEASAAMAPRFETIGPDHDSTIYPGYFDHYVRTYVHMRHTMRELSRMARRPGQENDR